ncbi:MAG: GspE/PulE family protein [Candidatus Dojkabacteria bacterium]|nr:MAG: GspE/PulE family protein [Candidatus Dojkabacteria bacterium]
MALPYTGVDLRLLNALVQQGKLTNEQAEALKLESAQQSKSEITLILEKNLLSETDVYRVKAQIYNVPFIEDISGVTVPQEVLTGLNVDTLKEQMAFPFEITEQKVKVLMADPFNVGAIQFWRVRYIPRQIEVYTSTPSVVASFVNTKFGNLIGGEVASAVSSYKQDAGQSGIDETVISEGGDLGTDLQSAPVAKIVNTILVYGARVGASDIHIEPQENSIRVRYRIDGVMQERMNLPKDLQAPIVARIKILSNLKIDETRLPQDGRIFIKVDNRSFDLRVSTLPAIQGEKTVMRLLERTTGIPPLEESGLRGSAYRKYLETIKLTNGIILITGPTGSGKTRTLASTLSRMNDPKVNIITIEDPVEIRVGGINQVQIHHEIGLDFATVLRAVLRQDPNIIMVGEIRDGETATLAIRAALTGHLVLSTLHTNSAVAALTRLTDMGIESYLVSSTVKMVVAQRLVRTVCPYCREPYAASPSDVEELQEQFKSIQNFDMFSYLEALAQKNGNPPNDSVEFKFAPPVKAPETLPDGTKQMYLYKGKGCSRCGESGYKGRMAIFEVISITPRLGEAITQNVPYDVLQKIAVEEGMITMYQDGFLKAIEGITSMAEVMRVAKSE